MSRDHLDRKEGACAKADQYQIESDHEETALLRHAHEQEAPNHHDACTHDGRHLVALANGNARPRQSSSKRKTDRERGDQGACTGRRESQHALQEQREGDEGTYEYHALDQRQQSVERKDLLAEQLGWNNGVDGLTLDCKKEHREDRKGDQQNDHRKRCPG